MATKTIFERHEKKYLLQPRQFTPLYSRLLEHLAPDEYGRHTICSLYFDTENDLCAHRQIEGLPFREKLRLRSYGVPQAEDTVYMELKKKLDGVTHKRRTALPLGTAQDYLLRGVPAQGTGQVFGEIDWFVRRHAPRAKSLVCYDRVALQGKTDASLRITFDEDIRYRGFELDLTLGDHGHPLCAGGEILMEIKLSGAFPLWLAQLLSQHAIYPVSFSKFRNTHAALLAASHRPVARPAARPAMGPVHIPAMEVLRHA